MRTYGSIRFCDSKWEIEKIEPHVAIKLKAMFPRVQKVNIGSIYLDSIPEICNDLSWFMQRYPFEMSKEDISRLKRGKKQFLNRQQNLETIFKPDYAPSAFQIDGELRKYQAQAVDVFLSSQNLLVGDVVGLGKTLIGIGAFTRKETLPALVVVQTHLPTQWKNQIEKFLHAKVHVIKGTKPYPLPHADVYIMKYSCLAGWNDVYSELKFKCVVFDEIQELRIEGSNKYIAACKLTNYAKFTLGLSATPIFNYGDEIYNILNLLKRDCLGSKSDFIREWTSHDKRSIKDPKAFGSYLRENYLFLRRTREDVGMELPKVNTIIQTVGYDEMAVKSIEEIARKLAIKVTTGSFIERGQAARELDIMVRQATGVSKAKFVSEYVKILLENNESVLLAGWHRDVYEIWLKELATYKPVMFTGSESGPAKEKAKNDFVNGSSNLMIISLRSGVGLDGLQKRCSIVVFGELDWSPAIHEQVEGRLNRDGQSNQVTSIYLVSDSGSDPVMVELLGLKSSEARSIVDPNSPVRTQHSDESRIRVLAESYLKRVTAPQGELSLVG